MNPTAIVETRTGARWRAANPAANAANPTSDARAIARGPRGIADIDHRALRADV
jgi:hypothetical protein